MMFSARRRFSYSLLAICFWGGWIPASSLGADAQPKIQPDIVYGHKDGMALTFDVIQPEKPNGAGVLWLQSGGWYSQWTAPQNLVPACRPLLDKGFTVFIVRHGSAPKYAVPDAIADVTRCVRFLHWRGADFSVDPQRLGVYGGSAGGHLSLMLGTKADSGNPRAADLVQRRSSRVAAVVALYPPTDIRTWVTDPPAAIKAIPGLKPPLTFDPQLTTACSPLMHVTADDAPTLLIHGDQDELVPLKHSQEFESAAKEAQLPCELLVIEGAGHGFQGKQNERVIAAMVDWFERHLVNNANSTASP